jgi:ADP-ribose pyrophosphatase
LTFVETDPEGTERIRCLRMPFDEAMRMLAEGQITHAPTCVALLKTSLSPFSARMAPSER